MEPSITMPANKNGTNEPIPYKTDPMPKANTEPIPPIKLMMPLARVRSFSGVISGIKATVGARNKLMDKFINIMNNTKVIRPVCKGIIVANTAPSGIPMSK